MTHMRIKLIESSKDSNRQRTGHGNEMQSDMENLVMRLANTNYSELGVTYIRNDKEIEVDERTRQRNREMR